MCHTQLCRNHNSTKRLLLKKNYCPITERVTKQI